MKKYLEQIIILGFIVVMISGCRKQEYENIGIPEDGNMTVGEKLENPYTVQNMQLAYENLKSTSPKIMDYNIGTSHYYIRFLPETLEELDLLEDDTTLLLSAEPLDYEIEKEGCYYHDPALPFDGQTWLYAVVEKDAEIPNVNYQVLDDLFLPPTPDELVKNYDDKWISFFDELEHEALKITNNLEGDEDLKSSKGSRWNPKGRITMWDDSEQDFVGIAHVRVRARRWFRTITAITDADGYYQCIESFKRPAKYKIVWRRYNFAVVINDNRYSDPQTGDMLQTYSDGSGEGAILAFVFVFFYNLGSKRAQYIGPKIKGDWSPKIDKGTPYHFHANIFRAAAHYYYGNIDGMRRPPLNDDIGTQMKIVANYDFEYYWKDYWQEDFSNHAVHRPGGRSFIDPAWIDINNTGLKTEEYAGIVIRELAHASLFFMDKDAYKENENEVKWCWSLGVEQFLMKKIYPTYHIKYSRGYYSGIVEDLMDGIDVTYCDYKWGYSEFDPVQYNDSVANYTIVQIENALQGAKSVNEWKENLKTMYDNETEEHLDATFSFWFDID